MSGLRGQLAKSVAAGAVVLVLSSGSVRGQDSSNCEEAVFQMVAPDLAILDKLVIEVDDQVKDGCWARPSASRTVVELELHNQNIQVLQEKETVLTPVLRLVAVGYESRGAGLCVVSGEASLLVGTAYDLPLPRAHPKAGFSSQLQSFAFLEVWARRAVFSSGKSEMQTTIKDYFEEAAESLVLDIVRSRSQFLDACPQFRHHVK